MKQKTSIHRETQQNQKVGFLKKINKIYMKISTPGEIDFFKKTNITN